MFSFPHVNPDVKKLAAQIGGWVWKKPSAHYVSVCSWGFCAKIVFFNISSGDLYFDALVISTYLFADEKNFTMG